jgi:predicted kinase
MRELIILTGPPGAGKEEYAKTVDHTVYDQTTKAMWRDDINTAVLITAAPTIAAKDYWCKEARRFGFKPVVLVLDPGRGLATQRLVKREMGSGMTDRRRARLAKTVQRWYAAYEEHPNERKVARQPIALAQSH